jgi:hypothetical protein
MQRLQQNQMRKEGVGISSQMPFFFFVFWRVILQQESYFL